MPAVSHGMKEYTVSFILNNICRIGIISENEKILRIAERMLSMIEPPR